MDLQALQNEINHLLFLYFTSIGSIQRDASLPSVDRGMKDLVDEIVRCKGRIDRLLADGGGAPKALPDDFDGVVGEGRDFICDGLHFIDKIVRM